MANCVMEFNYDLNFKNVNIKLLINYRMLYLILIHLLAYLFIYLFVHFCNFFGNNDHYFFSSCISSRF